MQMERLPRSPYIRYLKTYRIRVLGKLDESWSDWFDGMVVKLESETGGAEFTTLTGKVVDQAALFGILNRLRDLNIPLLSVQLVDPESEFGRQYER